MIKRIPIFLALLAVVFTAGCQSASPAATGQPTASATEQPTVSAAAQPTASTAGTRTIEHAFGTTNIPANPQRIVAADLGAFIPTFGVLSALGVRPIAVTADRVPAYLSQYTDGMQILPGQPNYEAIAALKPDLIITPGVEYNRKNYETLAQIAPTVAPTWYWQTIEQMTGYWRAVAMIVNKQAAGEKLVADLQAQIGSMRTALEPRMQGKLVSVLQAQQLGLQGLYLQTGRIESALLNAVGVARPANQTYDPNNPQWYREINPELLGEADAWAMFVEVYADNPNDIPTVRQQLEANPLWSKLEAVQRGRVFFVETDKWSGTDPFVAQLILDTIEKNLTAALAAEGS